MVKWSESLHNQSPALRCSALHISLAGSSLGLVPAQLRAAKLGSLATAGDSKTVTPNVSVGGPNTTT